MPGTLTRLPPQTTRRTKTRSGKDGPLADGPRTPDASPLSLRRNFSWTLAGNVVNSVCQWGVIITVAKLGSPELVGLYAIGLAVVAPVLGLTDLRLRSVLATDANGEYAFAHYLILRLLGVLIALFAVAAVSLLSGYRTEAVIAILAAGLSKGIQSISDILHGCFQRHERMDRAAVSMFLSSPLTVGLCAAGIALTGSIVAGILGTALARMIVLMGYDVPTTMRLTAAGFPAKHPTSLGFPASTMTRWNWPALFSLLRRSLPLGAVTLLTSLNINIPRYFIESQSGERWLGIFSSMAALMVITSMVVTAMGQAVSPRLACHFTDRRMVEFRRLVWELVGLVAVIGAAAVLLAISAGTQILTFVYGAKYAGHADVLVWLMIAQMFGLLASLLGCIVTATRRFHQFTVPYAATTLVTFVSSVILIPPFGMLGAAWTMCVSAIAMCVAPLVLLKKAWRMP